MSEWAEVAEAEANGIDIYGGNYDGAGLPAKYDVQGILLPRPFKITKIGPVDLFVRDVARATDFYVNELGFVLTEETNYQGHRCVFLRNGNEHHSLALLPKELRDELGCSPHTSCASFGLEVGTYQQLKDCVSFLKDSGVTFKEMPEELHPGVDYVAYAQDPDGHLLQIYYYMEQPGLAGQAPPHGDATPEERRVARNSGSPVRHLRRPSLPRPTGLIRSPQSRRGDSRIAPTQFTYSTSKEEGPAICGPFFFACLSGPSWQSASPTGCVVSGDGLEDAEGRALRVSQKGKAADGRLAFKRRNVGCRHMDGGPQRLGLLPRMHPHCRLRSIRPSTAGTHPCPA